MKSPLETEGVFVRLDALVTSEIILMLENECAVNPHDDKLKEKNKNIKCTQ